MAKFDANWSVGAERLFINGLGTWGNPGRKISDLSISERKHWLAKYILAHSLSTLPHHQDGVVYAKRKLKGMW